MATYGGFTVVVSNAAMAEISKRLNDASEGEGSVTLVRKTADGYNEIVAEFPGTWLPDAADGAWVDALQTWLDNDGSAVAVARANVKAALAS